MDVLGLAAKVAIFFVPFLFSLCFHEYAHGLMARFRGDKTAEWMGRLTMNPLAHIDWIGTVMLPILAIVTGIPIFFGWAKPVPVNPNNLKNPRTDMFWVALAGPLSNLFLAFVSTVIMVLLFGMLSRTQYMASVLQFFTLFLQINLFLAFFNLIPLHPLDGGKVLARFLPANWNYKLEQNESLSSMILMFVILSGGTKFLAIPVQWTAEWMLRAVTGVF